MAYNKVLFGAAIFAVLLGIALSARGGKAHNRRAGPRPQPHQMPMQSPYVNPFIQARHPLTQGFLCDWCVVSVEDGQAAVRDSMDQIIGILERASTLCYFCPVPDQCTEFLTTEVPQFIGQFLNESANDVCAETGLCDANATIQGMVMGSLRSDFARDRVIKRMLMRARVMQQKMIRIILGDDYMCTTCTDMMQIARSALLDNETEHEIVTFLGPLCAFLPAAYSTECDEFVQGLPDLMAMIANDVLTDGLCTEMGFCNQTKSTPDVSLPDITSRLGLPGVLPVMPGNQNPFQFPGSDRQYPIRLPGQGRLGHPMPSGTTTRNPYGQNPYGRNPYGRNPYGRNPYGRNPFQFPSDTRPEQRPNQRPDPRPYKPQVPKDPLADAMGLPETINMDDIASKIGGFMAQLPDIGLPDIQQPNIDLSMIPGFGRQDQQRRQHGGKKGHRRGQRAVADLLGADWAQIQGADQFLGIAKDTIHEYLPEAIPDEGITIIENGADEDCELCKVAVAAATSWLEENAPKLKKMISKFVVPVCNVFPSPMKEDCAADMRELIQTAMDRVFELLQPEPLCEYLEVCVAPEVRGEIVPTTQFVDMATEAKEVPPTEEAAADWPIPILNKFKDFKFPI